MVEVFKTNVDGKNHAAMLVNLLVKQFAPERVNFDLEDCDRVLRVEGLHVPADQIMNALTANGYQCQVME